MTPLERALAQFPDAKRVGDKWLAHCPAHADRRPSLQIREGTGGCVLLKCWAGCCLDDILATGLERRDLFPPGSQTPRAARPALSPRETALRAVLRDVRRHAWAWRLARLVADQLRHRERAIDDARRAATAAGPRKASWDALETAAAAERELRLLEPLLEQVWDLVTRAPADERDRLLDVLERGPQ